MCKDLLEGEQVLPTKACCSCLEHTHSAAHKRNGVSKLWGDIDGQVVVQHLSQRMAWFVDQDVHKLFTPKMMG